MILVDENIEDEIVALIKSLDLECISIKKEFKGISDKEIIKKSKELNAIIITKDKDFGEWYFSFKYKAGGVIFLRFTPDELYEMIDVLHGVLSEGENKFKNSFVTITTTKIRYREI